MRGGRSRARDRAETEPRTEPTGTVTEDGVRSQQVKQRRTAAGTSADVKLSEESQGHDSVVTHTHTAD